MEVKETDLELKINLSGDILFDFDKATLRPAAEPTLMEVVARIQKHPRAKVLIEGHSDSKGKQPYNLKLSERRAASVKTWLAAKGIAEANVKTRGWGASKPVAPNSKKDGADDPDGRQKNRRVEITIKK
jgi:outer membrane protein OmpA-like peptidoglycan-associated protein